MRNIALSLLLLSCGAHPNPQDAAQEYACHVTYTCDGMVWGPTWAEEISDLARLRELALAGDQLCAKFRAEYVCPQREDCAAGCVPSDAGVP